jgi:hypothetical protein
MSESVVPPPQALVLLIERIRNAVHDMESAGSLEHRRGYAAAQALEFEIKPLLDMFDVEAIVAEIATEAIRIFTGPKIKASIVPINSGLPIRPGNRLQIIARPLHSPMRIQRISIANADHFVVHDIRIGNRSQLPQAVPGSTFSESDTNALLDLETLQTSMDLALEVEYVGANPLGEWFVAAAIGFKPAEHAPWSRLARRHVSDAVEREPSTTVVEELQHTSESNPTVGDGPT